MRTYQITRRTTSLAFIEARNEEEARERAALLSDFDFEMDDEEKYIEVLPE